MNELAERIQNVAIYLRRSRGDESKDLMNHMNTLTSISEGYGWEFRVYQEVGSGSSLDERVEMLRLLHDVEQGEYDAILAMDIDRLTRGGGADRERLLTTLRNSDVYIVTGNPFDILDLNSDTDIETVNFKGFFSEYEYRVIRKRLQAGKVASLKQGNWVYGKSPFGYEYNRDTKRLDIIEEEAETIRMLFNELEDMNNSSADVARKLNSLGLFTRYGKQWLSEHVNHVAKNEVYLGHTYYNKSSGTRGATLSIHKKPYRRYDRSKWKLVENTHEPIITQEQFDKVNSRFESSGNRNNVIRRGRPSSFEFAGLCFTPDGISYRRLHQHKGTPKESMMPRLPIEDGGVQTIQTRLVKHAITQTIELLEETLIKNVQEKKANDRIEFLQKKEILLQEKIKKTEESFEKIIQGYINGMYDDEKAKQLTTQQEMELDKTKKELKNIKNLLIDTERTGGLTQLERIQRFKESINKPKSAKEMNTIYKSFIQSIVINKVDNYRVDIKVVLK